MNTASSAVLTPAARHATARPAAARQAARKMTDAITLEVIQHRLDSVVREMANITMRTARSAVVHSGRDFSCALFDDRGQLLAIGTSIPPHILPMLVGLRGTLALYKDDIAPGDIFIGNDPYDGGTHLNDVLIFIPLFAGDVLVGFSANRAHWPDVGGSVPGSISGTAREIFQEGIRIPPMRLGRNDRPDPDLLRFICTNVRLPKDVVGDLMGQLASCRVASQRILELVDNYGVDVVRSTFDQILDSSERRMRARIAALPSTTVRHEGYLDNDGSVDAAIRLRAAVTIAGDGLTVDYTGCAAQSAGCLNTSLGVTEGFAFMAIKAALDPKGPINSGSIRPIRVIAPLGSCLNANQPAACGGLGELGQIMIVTLAALSGLLPTQVTAEEGASANHQNFDGFDTRPGRGRYVFYDAISAGCGARATKDGLDFVRTLRSGNYTMMSTEVLENIFPLVFERQQFRADSGGPGRFRGGLGLDREYRVLNDGAISILGDHARLGPAGLDAGGRGAPTRWQVVRKDSGKVEPVSARFRSKGALNVRAGDIVRVLTPGGGGWGNAFERAPEQVRNDVLDDKVSIEQARTAYGVVIDPQTRQIDSQATEARRAAMRAARKLTTIRRGNGTSFESGMRLARVGPGSIWPAGSVIEVFTDTRPQQLTVCVHVDEAVAKDEVVLDAEAWGDLNLPSAEAQALVRTVVDDWT